MKKLLIAITVAGVLVLGAFAVVTIGSSGSAIAQSDTPETDTPQVETQATEDADVPEWVDDVLNGFIKGGVITQESADELRTEVPGLLGLLDQVGLSTNSADEFNPEDFTKMFEQFGFPEGFAGSDFLGPDGVDLGGLLDQFKNFDFGNFTFPEGFDHPEGATPDSIEKFDFPGGGFGFLNGLEGLTFSDLKDAMQNGTLSELIDPESILSSVSDKLDAAVANGTLAREQADKMLEKVSEKLDAIENGELPFFGDRFGNPHGQLDAETEQGA